MSARRWSAAAAWALAMVLGTGPAGAVTGGQSDTFQDGSTQGWATGAPSPNPPTNVASGGPAGAADRYLLATSSGLAGPGGRLVLFNTQQWTGDFLAAGIDSLSMDVSNLGSTALELHLALNNSAYTIAGVPLPAASGWTTVSFSLLPANIGGAGSTVLANVSELRLYHGGSSPALVAAQLGIDNITAVAAVPEPAAALLWLSGLAGLLARSRRRHSGQTGP